MRYRSPYPTYTHTHIHTSYIVAIRFLQLAINMARGPNAIYQQCVAKARETDKILAGADTDDVIREINLKYGYPSMLEKDVKRVFFENNYGENKTDKAIRQWIELSYVARVPYKRYWAILFMDYQTAIKPEVA